MKLSTLSSLFIVLLILILSGCGVKPKPKDEAVVDPTLPKITLTQNGAQSTMSSIALEWMAITDKRVRGIYVYKKTLNSDDDDKKNFLYTINNRFSTHFLDQDVKPSSTYTYYFKTYSDQAESLKSKEFNINTRPLFKSVSWLFAKNNMPRSAKIIWRPHKNKSVNAYLIQRKTLENSSFKNIDKVYGRLNVEYIDTNLKDNHTYTYQIRALTFDKIASLASDFVTISTKALPFEVKNITATTNMAKKIKIKWEKTSSPDFSHYNVYRSKDANRGYSLIAKVVNNSYIDNIKKDAKKYFYRVSVVDMDTLESNHKVNSALGMTLVKPIKPALLEATLIDNKIILKWNKTDTRTKSYIVIKKYKKGLLDFREEIFENIKNTNFVDKDIVANTTYRYQVLSVDKNAISSDPSIEAEVKTKEIKVNKVKPLVEEVRVKKVEQIEKIEVEKIEEVKVENF